MRQLEGIWSRIVSFVAIGLAGFHLYTGMFGLLTTPEHRAVHVGLALALVFALHPGRKSSRIRRSIPWWDLVLIVLILMAAANIFVNWPRYMPFMQSPATPFELFLAVAATLLVLEAGRRTVGWIFPILTAMCVAYTLWGHYIPGEFGHGAMKWQPVLTYVYFSTRVIWGFLTGISSTYIALFVSFGAILLATGTGKTFIDLAMLVVGRFRGGSAKVAVVASGFFAMLSGSSIANVATTGTFTIPMMKKLGYRPEFAGGVETTASTGGIVTPPIMGAAGFILAEFLSIPYLKVVIAAAIPAFLFYVAVFMGVHFEAVKQNLAPIPREELPQAREVFTWSRMMCLILPIGILLYTLLTGRSLILVASSACIMALVTYIFSSLSLRGIKERLWNIPHVLEAVGKAIMSVVPVLVCANIVIGLLTYTGLGAKISAAIMGLGEAHLLLSLAMAGVLVMILGCGLTVTASYVLGTVMAVPMLIEWGITPMAAHLFILYYSILGTITPPVCPTVYVAANIAKSDWVKTAWVALRLAPLLYIVPFLFIFDNTFIMMGAPWAILLNVSTAAAGAVILVSGTIGQLITKCKLYESLVLVAAGILLLIPGWTDLLGVALVSIVIVRQIWERKKYIIK